MSSIAKIEPPQGSLIQWAAQNPEQVRAMFDLMNSLANMEAVVRFNGKIIRCPIIISGENAQIQINLS